MKRSLIALAIVATSATVPVQAQSFVAETIGGITGAVLCNQIGGGKKDLQFILFGDVMTGHSVWFHDKDKTKIDFVKRQICL